MPIDLVTPPTEPAVSLADAKLHLRVENSLEDTLIQAQVDAATQAAEHIMQRGVMPQQRAFTAHSFPVCRRPLTIRFGGITDIESISYVDTDGQTQPLDASAYTVTISDRATHISPTQDWPDTDCTHPLAVSVIFDCGWQDAAHVPAAVRSWILLRLAALYELRSAWTQGQPIQPNEHIDLMLDRYRVFSC